MYKSRNFLLSSLFLLPSAAFAIDTYDPDTGVVYMPVVNFEGETYEVSMQHTGDLVFQVVEADLTDETTGFPDSFDFETGVLQMPYVELGDETYAVEMVHQGNLVFKVTVANLLTSSSGGLSGTWIKPCGVVDEFDEDSFYDTIELTFNGDQFDSSIHNYVDAACTVPLSFAPNPTSSGTITEGGNVTTPDGITATELDSRVTQFNGAPFDIYDYTIYYVDGNVLYFGDISGELDGTSESLRSDSLDYNRVYYRQ